MSSGSEIPHHDPFQLNYSELDDSNFAIHGSTLYTLLVLIAIVVTVVFLFFYGRWIFRLSRSRSLHELPHQGLDQDAIEKLSVVLYKVCGDYTDQAECCICLGMFGEKEEVKVLPNCGHCFHSSCVDKWLKGHSSCPLCRASIKVDSPV